ncbi:MAG: hypothetical protein A2589_00955 [Candidatus Vogelbacteria bacterium RIFOXYD1_FULL_46_19]|uniref:Phosphoribosyltransferase domain-containing protein n=1 Tax=Candidatus Vogelbacteria bacterium RIFOXYD1_FULL_46_19 TaxID=1802439 RepID=A0A1G2QFP1_9BACT|nr:MAG: hypothetical protein A2589_00955 [Candidatus Vogelbacteria bacterium RIFOXYD1_FULL_46_19]
MVENNKKNELKMICLEEILRQKTIIFNECVMFDQHTTINGAGIDLRPITYIDLPVSSPRYLDAVGEYIYGLQKVVNYRSLCGIATQGLSYTYSTSIKYNIPAIYFRKEPQKYGTNSHLAGKLTRDQTPTLIIDNLIYSGKTLNLAVSKLKESDISIAGLFTVVKFETSFSELIVDNKLFYLLTVKEIYDYLIQNNYFPKNIEKYIKLFLKDQTLFHSKSEIYLQYLSELKKSKTSF